MKKISEAVYTYIYFRQSLSLLRMFVVVALARYFFCSFIFGLSAECLSAYDYLFTGGYRGTNYLLKKSKNIYIRSECDTLWPRQDAFDN